MSRVIVSIVSEQTVPNYLFIKEKYKEGDELLFISSEKFKSNIDLFSKVLGKAVNSVILAPDAEEKWNEMKKALEEHLSKLEERLCDVEYLVNLTGGTKYMTLLVYSVFENKNSEFYYIPLPKNEILRPGQDKGEPIKYRMTVEEYFKIHGVIKKETIGDNSQRWLLSLGKTPDISEDYTKKFFDKFVKGKLDFDVIDKLRCYRDKKKINISDVQSKKGTDKFPQIQNLQEFLDKCEFQPEDSEYLSKDEINYLTGGWFEEYVYHRVKKELSPTDIRMNCNINYKKRQNELDVIFTLGNKLFILECKTGGLDKVGIFNETINKLSATKSALLGLSSSIYMISLRNADENLGEVAKSMNAVLISREDVLDEKQWKENFISKIIKYAND